MSIKRNEDFVANLYCGGKIRTGIRRERFVKNAIYVDNNCN